MEQGADDTFIELNRTFHELQSAGKNGDEDDLFSLGRSTLDWAELISKFRAVILSEAGSGKTEEIRNAARKLRLENKPAFFLRLEHVASDFDDAFEEGTADEFQQWLQSADEGWLLLDSIDEARLKNPSDFERALRKIAARIKPALQRTHVIVTGRTTAWRPKTDLALFKNQFPFSGAVREATEASNNSDVDPDAIAVVEGRGNDEKRSPFWIVALDELREQQIRLFAHGRKVADVDGLLDAIERADAYTYTARPQDLGEVIEFWEDEGRIGSRSELMQNSILRRLAERDQNRAEIKSMDAARARAGAVRVAGAATMAQEQTIRVPDGAENREGLPVTRILPEWDEQECSILLNRPIFDEAIYGAVRFHHRSVREYLAAEWLAGLLSRDSSRQAIEELLFREQYGLEVIVPSLRPILPWLILLDQGICDRALRLAPELVFEGGDPARLPLETRRRLLTEICTRTATDKTYRANSDLAAVQRFASGDLADDIELLLERFGSSDEVSWILLRMIWQGQLKQCLPAAIRFALDARAPKYTRVAAFRAVAALGSSADQANVRASFLKERRQLDREWLAELISHAAPDADTADWLVRALAKTPPRDENRIDGLGEAIWQFIEAASPADLRTIAVGLGRLIKRAPYIDPRHYQVSARFRWLAKPAAFAVQRLIDLRHPAALEPTSLDILHRFAMAMDHHDFSLRNKQMNLIDPVRAWPDLNEALFWFEVAGARKRRRSEGKRLDDWWDISHGASLWLWTLGDSDRLLGFVRTCRLVDDRLIALSVLFHLYRNNERPPALRRQLWNAVKGNVALEARLATLMRPPAQAAQTKAWKRSHQRWKRRSEARDRKEARYHEGWRSHLMNNLDKLRDPGFKRPNQVSNAQQYLHHQTESENHSSWRGGDWRSLTAKFGNDIAHAYRDGCVAFWRRNRPEVRSEGAPGNTTYLSTIFGLSGLGIEADETADWPSKLNESDAELATRYALFELNGYPDWMPRLFAAFPDAVIRVLHREVLWELANAIPDNESLYALYDVSWYGEWMWERWAPIFLADLAEREPVTIKSLPQMLKVLHGSSLPDEQIRDLAASKCASVNDPEHLTHWYASWVGVDPASALPKLERYIDGLKDASARLDFAMKFVTSLLGGRRSDYPAARSAYRTAAHLKTLYLLMHRYIRERDDIQRAGTGVYSPGLRDNAQDARNQLFSLLNEIPGKEAFLALTEISRAHPEPGSRPWFSRHARIKAQQDVESGRWSLEQFVDFNNHLERTPANNSELFDLARMRLLDLKNNLERGDSSIASILRTVTSETEMRKYIGDELRKSANNRFVVPQEEELADATRPDIRIHGVGFDAPLPVELKLADNWTGPHLLERLENQLCRDYLRDPRSQRGIFALVYRGDKKEWELPASKARVDFLGLLKALETRWTSIAPHFPNAIDINILGIDLTQRQKKEAPH
jgi:hypothetical protein